MKHQQYPSPGAVGYAGQHPAVEHIDWALQNGPEVEHLDELEDNGTRTGMSPYASTEAAQRVTRPEPEETGAGVEQVRHDASRYAAAPFPEAVPTREEAATDWSPSSYFLQSGQQSLPLAPKDPYRKLITVRNHTDGDVWLANSNNQTPGAGSMLLPARDASGMVHEVTMTHREAVYLFTQTGYAPGASNRPVVVSVERYG